MTSLRARLVVWSSALLVVALVAFGSWVTISTWRGWLADVDARLASRLGTLTTAVLPAGDDAFDLVLPAESATGDENDYYAIWDAHGQLLIASDPDRPGPRPEPGILHVEDTRAHVARLPSGVTILAGRRIDTLTAAIRELILVMTGVGLVALALVVTGSWWLIGRALTPVTRIGVTAQAMIDGDLTARIPMSHVESELEAMAAALNEAFDRLYASLERQRQFSADASHDLRTPLTTLRTETHWALAQPRTPEEYRASLEVCQRTATRMHDLVTSLLSLARAESASGLTRVSCDVAEAVHSVVDELRPLAESRDVTVTGNVVSGLVFADPVSFRAALTNLVANAIQYNRDGGLVEITTDHSRADHVTLAVRDTGVGLAPHDAARIFDRFYRVDPSRDRSTGGSGLGLALVDAFARTHGGEVSVQSTPGEGSIFTLTLPTQRN